MDDAALVPRRRFPFLGATLFAGAYLAALGTFAYLDVWRSHFFDEGRIYALYNLLRVLFLGYLCLICATVGQGTLALLHRKLKCEPVDRLDRILITSYLGAAVLIVVVFLLGLCQLYYKAVALVVTSPLVFFSYGMVKSGVQDFSAWLRTSIRELGWRHVRVQTLVVAGLLVVVVALLGFRLLAFGIDIDLDLATRDVPDHYMPNYLEMMHLHGLRPTHYFHQYHYTKGAGLHFLSVLLTDVHSFQLASFYLSVLSVLALYRLVQLGFGGGHFWPLLTAVLYLTCPPTLSANYQKLHGSMAALLVFPVYLLVLWIRRARPVEGGLAALAAVSIATIVLLPPSIVLLLPFLVCFVVLLLVHRERVSIPHLGLLLAAPVCAYAFVLVCNYRATGVFEITPLNIWARYANYVTMSDWYSPSLWYSCLMPDREIEVDWSNVTATLTSQNLTAWIWEPGMLPASAYSYLLGASVVWFALCRRGQDPAFGLIGVLCAAALGLGVFIELTNNQDSTSRFLVFRFYFKVLLYVWVLVAVCRLTAGSRWHPGVVVVLVGVAVWYGCTGAYPALERLASFSRETLRFARGRSSFAKLYDRAAFLPNYELGSPFRQVRAIRDLIGAEARVWAIDQQHSPLANVPGRQFCYMIPDYPADTDRILAGSANVARDVLEKKYGLRYFLVSVAPIPPPGGIGPVGLSPLFDERSLVENFRVVGQVDKCEYLLTWRDNQTAAAANRKEMEPFLSQWVARRKMEDNTRWVSLWYERYVRLGHLKVAARMWDQSPAIPQVALFTNWRVSPTSASAAVRFLDPKFDPRQELVIETDPGLSSTSPTPCTTIATTVLSPGRMEAEVEGATNGILLFQEDWRPFWKAQLNGQDVPVLRANAKYLALAVPAGRHRVAFHYHDRYMPWALCACAGLVLGVVFLVCWALWQKRTRSGATDRRTPSKIDELHSHWVAPPEAQHCPAVAGTGSG